MCYILSHMKQATVRELRNDYSKVMRWVARGDEVQVTRRGKVIARVLPPLSADTPHDWTASAALRRPGWKKKLTAGESAAILTEAKGGA